MNLRELRACLADRPQTWTRRRWWHHTLKGMRYGLDLRKWELRSLPPGYKGPVHTLVGPPAVEVDQDAIKKALALMGDEQ